jgi:hypothetical protein
MVAEGDVLDSLELGSLALPWVPGKTERLDVPGVIVRSSTISSPYVNLASMTRLDARAADDAIARVRDHFAARGAEVGWITGPRTRPADLAARLQRAGFRLLTGYAGLACDDLALSIDTPADVVVSEVGLDHRDEVDRIKAESFAMPLAAARWIDELLMAGVGKGGATRARVYLARRADDPEWAAFGQGWYAPGGRVLILGGGGVLRRARGQGLFRALVARRLRDAQADGVEAATMQAMDATSAPIMKRLGFVERTHMDLWVWSPEGAAATQRPS